MPSDILPQLEELLLTKDSLKLSPVSGGDINDSYRVQNADKSYFLKVNSADKFRMLELERDGLMELENTGVFKTPRILGCGKAQKHSFLLMEWLHEQKPSEWQWQLFGEHLSKLHSHTRDSFGFKSDNYIGSIHQKNDSKKAWSSFYIDCRIAPLIKKAYDSGFLEQQHLRAFERLSLEAQSLFPFAQPSLLHGDLWAGNFMCIGEKAMAVFDPAVYYGHPEMEMAFTLLFGGFPAIFYDAYQSQTPLEKGFHNRVDLYNLYPNLVHLLLFGRAYFGAVSSVLLKFYR